MPWGEGPAAELRGLHLGGLCPKSSSLGHRTRNCPGKVFTSTSLGFCRWPVPNLPAQRPPGVAQPGPPAELHAGEGPTLETPLPRGVGVWMAPSSLAQGLGARPPALDRQGGWGLEELQRPSGQGCSGLQGCATDARLPLPRQDPGVGRHLPHLQGAGPAPPRPFTC